MNKKTVVFLTVAMVFASLWSIFAWADSIGECTVTDKSGKKIQMTMYVKGDLRMTEVEAEGQVVKSILDEKNKKMIVVMDSAKMCMTRPYSPSDIEPGKNTATKPDGTKLECKWKNTAIDASKFKCPTDYKSM